MKKAILIVGIIWIIICLGTAIAEITYGAGQLQTLTGEQIVVEKQTALGISNIVVGAYYVIAIIFTLVLILKRNSNMSKGAGIALGVVSIVFGSLVPGILFIVDSANNRK